MSYKQGGKYSIQKIVELTSELHFFVIPYTGLKKIKSHLPDYKKKKLILQFGLNIFWKIKNKNVNPKYIINLEFKNSQPYL